MFEDILDKWPEVKETQEELSEEELEVINEDCCDEEECDCGDECENNCKGCGHHLEYGDVVQILTPTFDRKLILVGDNKYKVLITTGHMVDADKKYMESVINYQYEPIKKLFNIFDSGDTIKKALKEILLWQI